MNKNCLPTKKIGVVILLKKDNRYLLIKQNKKPYKDFWAPVHGQVEAGESDQEAIIREAQEEIGIQVSPIQQVAVSKADYKVHELHWWIAEFDNCSEINIDTAEISEYGYFQPHELLALNLLPETRFFFRRLFKKNHIAT